MSKTRYKLLRYLIVLVPLALTFFSPLAESVRWWFLSGYEIRWYAPKPAQDERSQLITIRNNGSGTLGKARVRLNVISDKPFPIADFSFARLRGGPPISFVDSIARSDSIPSKTETDLDQLLPVLDTHSESRTLFSIEQALNEILWSRMRTNGKLIPAVDALKGDNHGLSEWHHVWSAKCNKNGTAASAACQQGSSVIQAWEISRQQLYEKGREKWFDLTGVDLTASDTRLSPSGSLDFTFDVAGNESCFLRVNYNPDTTIRISSNVEVLSSSIATSSEVLEEKDLTTPLGLFLFKYNSKSIIVFLLVSVGVLYFCWPVIRPKQLLPIDKVFRIALSTDDEEYWEHAYQRYRFYITQQFRDLRHKFKKSHLKPGDDELFDYVRNSLIIEYGGRPSALKSEKQLKQFINKALEPLVEVPT